MEMAIFTGINKEWMTRTLMLVLSCIVLLGCKARQNNNAKVLGGNAAQDMKVDFTIAFGSCNKSTIDNVLWDDVLDAEPDIWIWGGDNIYADTEDIEKISAMYEEQSAVSGYRKLAATIPVIGTWDDHDYGENDAGVDFPIKRVSQQAFMDFMRVPKDSPRRSQEGIYTSHEYKLWNGSVKVIVLDTRYFRTALTPDHDSDKRNKPNAYGEGTILGETQWQWLQKELETSTANFTILVSSIQVLSNEHGWECWGNFPHEVDRLKKLISDSGVKGAIVLSGDRHISEFSQIEITGLDYPLIDFTSSGLTHAYSNFKEEHNPFRVGSVVATESFGLLRFDFLSRTAQFVMVGDDGEVLNELSRKY